MIFFFFFFKPSLSVLTLATIKSYTHKIIAANTNKHTHTHATHKCPQWEMRPVVCGGGGGGVLFITQQKAPTITRSLLRRRRQTISLLFTVFFFFFMWTCFDKDIKPFYLNEKEEEKKSSLHTEIHSWKITHTQKKENKAVSTNNSKVSKK